MMDTMQMSLVLGTTGELPDDAFPPGSPLAFMNGWSPYTESFERLQTRMELLWDCLWRNFNNAEVAQIALFALSGSWQIANTRFAMCAPDSADLRQFAKRVSPSTESVH